MSYLEWSCAEKKQCILFSTLEHLIYYIFRLPLIASNKPLIDILMIAETSQGFAYNSRPPTLPTPLPEQADNGGGSPSENDSSSSSSCSSQLDTRITRSEPPRKSRDVNMIGPEDGLPQGTSEADAPTAAAEMSANGAAAVETPAIEAAPVGGAASPESREGPLNLCTFRP